MFLNQSHCSEKFSSHVILETDWRAYSAATPCDGRTNVKSAGRAVVLESAETGLGPSEFLVGDAH